MQAHPYGGGWLEVIVGPMFSGKSEELIRRVTRALIARQAVQVFKPAIDDRYDAIQVASHAGRTLEAEPVDGTADLRRRLRDGGEVVAVDEAQFFDDDLPELVQDLADEGLRVIVAGLDLDFRGEPFGPLPVLLARAEHVEKLTAICRCGRAATRTQRLIGGHPAHYGDPVILVGAKEQYEPRCRSCHRVPRHERAAPLFAEAP
ncbi:MAG: thymidine kinase [Deinococcus-Thermus bacterium]|jgi:thymidine kinase|nr:thymidine kinase [Deinococcota bacterium]